MTDLESAWEIIDGESKEHVAEKSENVAFFLDFGHEQLHYSDEKDIELSVGRIKRLRAHTSVPISLLLTAVTFFPPFLGAKVWARVRKNGCTVSRELAYRSEEYKIIFRDVPKICDVVVSWDLEV